MRGFSLFAPVIGLIIITIAVSVSAMFYQNEIKMMHRVGDAITQASSFSLTEAMKNDMITMFAVGLREYFLEFHEYNVDFFTSPDMPEVGKEWLRNFFKSLEGNVAVGGEWVHVEVEDTGWKNIADTMSIKECGTRMLLVSFDVRHVNMPEMNISSPDGKVSTYVLPKAKIGFPVYFPVEDVETDLKNLEAYFKNADLSYGFCEERSIKPAIIFKGQAIAPENPKDVNDDSDPTFPCYLAGEMVDGTKINAWKHTEDWAMLKLADAINEDLSQKGSDWRIDAIKVLEREEEDTPYVRVFCITPPLTKVVSNGGAHPYLCFEAQQNEDMPKCYHAKKIEVYASKEYTNPCAPGKKVIIRAKFTVDLPVTSLGSKTNPRVSGSFIPTKRYGPKQQAGHCYHGCECCGGDHCHPCYYECSTLYTCNAKCIPDAKRDCVNLLSGATFFSKDSVCKSVISCKQKGSTSCGPTGCTSPVTPVGFNKHFSELYPPKCGCVAVYYYNDLWDKITEKIEEKIGQQIKCDSFPEEEERKACEEFYNSVKSGLKNKWGLINPPSGNYIISATFIKKDGKLVGVCSANVQTLRNIR